MYKESLGTGITVCLLTALQLSVVSWYLEQSLQTVTVIQGDINVKAMSLGNGDESEESYLHFLFQMINNRV
jgi:hypothetical protein